MMVRRSFAPHDNAQACRCDGESLPESVRVGGVAVAMLFLLQPTAAQQRADFIIIQAPQRLLILNQYQQQLSLAEKSAIPRFFPFRIINPDELLSDGLTECMKVDDRGAPLYFVKDDAGELIGAADAKRYDNVLPLNDTITVTKSNAIEFFDAGGRKRFPLASGARLRRVFQSSRLTFVQDLSTGAFGWVGLRDGDRKVWMISRAATPAATKTLDQFAPDIQRRLDSVNEKLTKLYEIWNRTSSEPRAVPQWRLILATDSLLAVLSGDSTAQFYKESTRWLSKELESLLIGTRFRVMSTTGHIEIRAVTPAADR